MLASLLAAHRSQIAMLAESWLQAGASCFSLWAQNQCLAAWPAGAPTPRDLVATVAIPEIALGELRISGLNQAEFQTRLDADAMWLSQWIQFEGELDGMTNELIEAQDQLLALYDLTRSTRSHLSIPETLNALAREAARLVKTKGAATLLWAADGTPILLQYPPHIADETWLQLVFEQARTTRREVLLNRNGINAAGLPDGVDNIFVVPIQIGGKIAAALALFNKPNDPFASPDMKLARAIAEQAGAQIENVQLYQEKLAQTRLETEMGLARRVQMNLLPKKAPAVVGLDVHAHTRPALEVGGDFYDLISTPDGPFTFVVADVSGKGISAALIMAMTRTVLRSACRVRNHNATWLTPAEIMSRATEELYDDLTEVSMFATIFLGQYNPQRRQLYYANLGHSPVIYCPAGGTARLLEADGPALGMLPINLSEDQSMPFGPGDLLIAATDGFNESCNIAGEMFGYERLLELVETLSDQSANDIATKLYENVTTFSAGHSQDDDQTIVVIKGVAG